MQMASQGTTLHIDHVEPGHAGLFSCQATNEAGTAGAEVELSVYGERARAARGRWRRAWTEAIHASSRSGGPRRDRGLVLSRRHF